MDQPIHIQEEDYNLITKEKLELASEYRGIEKLYRDFMERYYPFRAASMMSVHGNAIDTTIGVPVECIENAILRMKSIRTKLRSIDKIFHINLK